MCKSVKRGNRLESLGLTHPSFFPYVESKDTLVFGSQGTEHKWRGASDHCSPNYTLDIAGFPVVKAK
jgi:hypothetical protein